MKVLRGNYQCDVCGKIGYWDENWSWFGSYEDMDNGRKVDTVCSEECKIKYEILKSKL